MIRRLSQRQVEKPWGRRDLPPPFRAEGSEPVGEIWFEAPEAAAGDLLVKYLFTSEKLSVQVHPDDEAAPALGFPHGKDEAWYVLAAEEGATLGIGLVRSVTREQLRAAALDGSIEALLDWLPAKPGDFHYLPAGTVHAIGAGVSLVEVQQNVDATLRLYDYGRPRAIQPDEAAAIARLEPSHRTTVPSAGQKRRLTDGGKFTVILLTGPCRTSIDATPETPHWLVPLAGGVAAGGTVLEPGGTWQAEGRIEADLAGDARLLVAWSGERGTR